jgi:hypothetical protein
MEQNKELGRKLFLREKTVEKIMEISKTENKSPGQVILEATERLVQ